MIRRLASTTNHFYRSTSIRTFSMVEQTHVPSWFMSAENALKIDQDLMGPQYKYTLAQLMELAGLSVA